MPNSAWTETGASISLAPVTTPVALGSSPENVNYLTNADKIRLMAQYSSELSTKTQLDTTASNLGVDSSAYDNAVAQINTGLVAAGAPSDWATIWPDGTTSGPWSGIQNSLSNWWQQVATQRAALQTAISNQQAANAQAAATSAAATDATNKMNQAVSIAAPIVVSGLPTLPDSTYPSGKVVWNSADSKLYQSTGSAWTLLAVDAANLVAGSVTAGQIAAGAIGADQIAAGAITAKALTLTDTTNLVPNPNSAGMAPGGAAWPSGSYEAAGLAQGNGSVFNPPTNGYARHIVGNNSGETDLWIGPQIPVKPGDSFTFGCTVYNTGGNASCKFGLAIFDVNGTNDDWAGTTFAASGNISGTYTCPATLPNGNAPGAVQPYLIVEAAAGSNEGYFNFLYLRHMTDANLIVDGSITTAKIDAGGISADVIKTGTLDASVVTVDNLDASNITTGTMSASKVLFADGSALTTAARVSTTKDSVSSVYVQFMPGGGGIAGITGLSWSVSAEASDTFNLWGLVNAAYDTQPNDTPADGTVSIHVYVDGVTTTDYALSSGKTINSSTTSASFPLFACITGLAAGNHTIQVYVSASVATDYSKILIDSAMAFMQQVR